MRKIVAVAVVAAVCVAGAYFALPILRPSGQAAAPQPAQLATRGQSSGPRERAPVEVARAREEQATGDIRAVGSLRSDEAVQIAPEIAGRIAEIVLKEGEEVAAGAVLVRLDDSLARAELAEAEARFDLAKANYDRTNTLARSGNVSERTRDEAVSAFQSAQAGVELARVRLAKHTLTAPFPGTVGLRTTSLGAYVAIGTPIVNLEKIDALKVDFKVPELRLADVRVGQSVEVTVDALSNATFTGTIYAIDPLVDVNGRALQIRARLSNSDRTLRPGLFARIVIKGGEQRNVVTVPESAISPRGGETYVFRVQDGKAIETRVRLGERKGGNVQVIEGLNPEATVVVAGQQRLRDGIAVEIVQAGNAPAPG